MENKKQVSPKTFVKCPKCKYDVEINIKKAYDETAEEWRCPKCGFIFRYIPGY